MASSSKSALFFVFEDAIRQSGWNFLHLPKGDHHARYRVFRDNRSFNVALYIWYITPGGNTRPRGEYRIQRTTNLVREHGAKNLVLGWWEEGKVFGGWDIREHEESKGRSPSMQVSESTLRQARISGFCPYVNQKNETAVAFRADFLGTYIDTLESLHESGKIPTESEVLQQISKSIDGVSEKEIEDQISNEERRYAVLTTRRAIRAIDFSRRVLSAYKHQCAMCGIQLGLVDGAHILPVADARSTDETSNGIALCALHHRAYDNALVTFDSRFKTAVNEAMLKRLRSDKRTEGIADFKRSLRATIGLPEDNKDHPAEKYVVHANGLRGWNSLGVG